MNHFAATSALVIALGAFSPRLDAAEIPAHEAARTLAEDAGAGRVHRDFFHAWRATGIELDQLAARAQADDFDRAVESARSLAQTIYELPRFSSDLAARRRSAYLRKTGELRVLADQVCALARSGDASGLKSALEELQAGRQELGQTVPRLWLSIASTLKGRTQPGSPLVIE